MFISVIFYILYWTSVKCLFHKTHEQTFGTPSGFVFWYSRANTKINLATLHCNLNTGRLKADLPEINSSIS